ncbi:DUF1343 domain-containing protein [Taibaiella lutea]|uniref:DUF1343 domain-containing protein n=1 Tax=Taibaiella lutea TaxID=2608001 RepID=A0A5M6CPK4_9BACT|nr:DUF1343 domain-containing protein [Taibaiella lutea]KAA5537007.1 DUF1343 domain-containing protein [Taibaiella lutea]
MKYRFPTFILILILSFGLSLQSSAQTSSADILTGADRTKEYLPLLKGKRVVLIVNQTSEINGTLLPDTLLKLGINVVKIFSPEHGFRGNADAGAHVKNGIDAQTGLQVISLYGDNKKPKAEQLKDIDILVYDLQDVGARFYTYISTLQYAMEACGEQGKPIIVLDRPNPLGFIIDGPVLEKSNQSFVGMQSIPVVYGMTAGEYAKMLIGEKRLSSKAPKLTVIPCDNYTHKSLYELPVSPSPNLKNMTAIYLYPSLCFFEGTVVSIGRGTTMPFQQFGNPMLKSYSYKFMPQSMTGATDPPLKNQDCYGKLIADNTKDALSAIDGKIQIKWLLEAYNNYPDKEKFFNNFFIKLAGTDKLQKQIQQGFSEDEIRKGWEPDLTKFKVIRKKYLLYKE